MRNQFLVYSLLASVSTATAGGTIGSVYGKDNGPAAVVKVAKSTCLSRYQRTITMSRSRHAEGLRLRPPENVTIDMRGITLLGQGPGSDAKSVTRVTGFKNVCLLGGRYLGKQDPQKVPWVVGHATYGAGVIFTGGSGAITVENAVIENSLQDGITLTGGLPNDVTFGMRGTHIKNNSDDGIQNDGGKKILFIEDSLIESKMGISIRPGADSTAGSGSAGNYSIPIRNTLWNLICVADDRPDAGLGVDPDRRNPTVARKNNCGPSRAVSSLFKWSGAASNVKVDMRDSIVRMEGRDRNGWKAMNWVAGNYENVLVVWDPRVKGMAYKGPPLPPGVTMTTDASVWEKAKSEWLRGHGCIAGGGCTFPNS